MSDSKKNGINKVSNSLNIGEINSNKNSDKGPIDIMYEQYCSDNIHKDFQYINNNDLKKIYDDGIELLNTYYITKTDSVDLSLISQVQFITSQIKNSMNNKKINELINQNNKAQNKLKGEINRVKKIEENVEKDKEDVENLKKEFKTIISAIVPIVLAISIIPTAVAGIVNMDTNFIAPFITSLMLFGMAMIAFMFSIYRIKVGFVPWMIIICMMVVNVYLWEITINKTIDISKKEYIDNEIKIEIEMEQKNIECNMMNSIAN